MIFIRKTCLTCCLLCINTETVGVIARNIGEETFAPIAKDCAEFALNLLNTVDDPDLRRCV